VYGCFNQSGCLMLLPGGAIPFDGTADASGIIQSGGELTLSRSGVYMVSLSISIPECAALKTAFQIRLDGNSVSGGTVIIDKGCASAPMHAGTQIALSAEAGAVLTVTSSAAVNLTTDGSSDPIAVLTVVKIG